jgi:lactoylglutathione lyase
MAMSDLGMTHIAFLVRDLAASIAFYERYAAMQVIHRHHGHDEPGPGDPDAAVPPTEVAWMSDLTRPFVIVLIQGDHFGTDTPLGPFGHIGIACASREEVDRRAALAATEGYLRRAQADAGPPVGYWCYLADPDGNTLELSYGQEVAFTVEGAEMLLRIR